jgi:hypothetical protein
MRCAAYSIARRGVSRLFRRMPIRDTQIVASAPDRYGATTAEGLNRCGGHADYVMKRPQQPGFVVPGEL